jgi:ferrochelatase
VANSKELGVSAKTRGLLLVNLGTPDSPDVPDVRRYLREFLSDPRVLDTSAVLRQLVLNLFILPFRPKQSSEAYRQIWTERGSPLLFHGKDLVAKIQSRLGDGVPVALAMRYQNPSIARALADFRRDGVDSIAVLPLFPQYSSAAWGSAVEMVFKEASKLWNVPSIQVVPPFYDHSGYLEAFADVARPVLEGLQPDAVVMSFHGLPERHCVKSDESDGRHCFQSPDCCETIVSANRNCYRAQCFATARGLGARLGISDEIMHVCFQSRLGRDPWIRPYTDEVILALARSGTRRVAVLSPAFVADCLETLEEIGIRARQDFLKHGGEELELVPSLNATDRWVEAIITMLVETTEFPVGGNSQTRSTDTLRSSNCE